MGGNAESKPFEEVPEPKLNIDVMFVEYIKIYEYAKWNGFKPEDNFIIYKAPEKAAHGYTAASAVPVKKPEFGAGPSSMPDEPMQEDIELKFPFVQHNKKFYVMSGASWMWHPNQLKDTESIREDLSDREDIISGDAEEFNQMVLSAKKGDWHITFAILDRKEYLINGIPEARSWSALHQAVYLKNMPAINKLLSYRTIDVDVKAKRDRCNLTNPGDTPLMLANRLQRREDGVRVINNRRDISRAEREVHPTYIPPDRGEMFIREGVPYFSLATQFINKDLLMTNISNMERSQSFLHLTEGIFHWLEENWQHARKSVAECVYCFGRQAYNWLSASEVHDSNTFFSKLIYIYTSEAVYRQVNLALLRASLQLKPTGDDMMLAMFSLFLESVLLHWNRLDSYDRSSYRGMYLPHEQLDMYAQGTSFVWLPFTSTAKQEASARHFISYPSSTLEPVLFQMDNSRVSKWRPKEIMQHSRYRNEGEVLYPSGAKFEVTDVNRDGRPALIQLKLLPFTVE